MLQQRLLVVVITSTRKSGAVMDCTDLSQRRPISAHLVDGFVHAVTRVLNDRETFRVKLLAGVSAELQRVLELEQFVIDPSGNQTAFWGELPQGGEWEISAKTVRCGNH